MDVNEVLKLLVAKDVQISELLKQIGTLQDELKKQSLLTEKLQAQLENLLRVLYGKKSEKQQSKHKSEEDNPAADDVDKTTSNNNSKNKPIRKKLPDNLEREIIKYELPEADRICDLCQQICHCIGKEVTEQLEFIPARLYVKEHRRYKYGCRHGCSVKIATMPQQPIPKGIPGPGLLAEILINKYQDALPLYRQSLRFKRHGIDIPETTMCDWVRQTAQLLQPLVKLMQKDLLSVIKIHTDDTPVPVLAKTKTKQGRLWVYVADGITCPCTIYDYTATRSQTAPQHFLAGFKGYLQADAYAGYDKLYATGDIIEVGCMAHVRRKFFEIAESAKGDSIAQDALDRIATIYAIESKCRGMDYKQRYYYRKVYLRDIYRKLRRWLLKKQKIVIPNTPIEKAINYALNHWRALQNVLADGRLEVDNNIAERAVRPVVVGRKNYLFAGSDQGAENAAIIYSIIETAKQNGLNTYEYLADLIAKVPNTKSDNLYTLLPYHYCKGCSNM
jgi:transposase